MRRQICRSIRAGFKPASRHPVGTATLASIIGSGFMKRPREFRLVWVSGVPETEPAKVPNSFGIMVSAAGLEPATHALKGPAERKINDLHGAAQKSRK
jgi:hypothetical protein